MIPVYLRDADTDEFRYLGPVETDRLDDVVRLISTTPVAIDDWSGELPDSVSVQIEAVAPGRIAFVVILHADQ